MFKEVVTLIKNTMCDPMYRFLNLDRSLKKLDFLKFWSSNSKIDFLKVVKFDYLTFIKNRNFLTISIQIIFNDDISCPLIAFGKQFRLCFGPFLVWSIWTILNWRESKSSLDFLAFWCLVHSQWSISLFCSTYSLPWWIIPISSFQSAL